MVADTLPLAAVQVAPPPELKDRIMSAVRAEAEVLQAAGPEADVVAREPAAAEEADAAAAPAERERKPRDQPWWRRPFLSLRPVPAAFAAGGHPRARRSPSARSSRAAARRSTRSGRRSSRPPPPGRGRR